MTSGADRQRRYRALRNAGFRCARLPFDVVAVEAVLLERGLLGEDDLEREDWDAFETALALYLEMRLQEDLERIGGSDW